MNDQKPRKTLSCSQVSIEYGFYQHVKFIDFLIENFPDCMVELENAGYVHPNKKAYIPKWQDIIAKHLGEPKYRRVSRSKLARAYGIGYYGTFMDRLINTPDLIEELKDVGFDPDFHRNFIPLWIDIIIKHFGMPEKTWMILKD